MNVNAHSARELLRARLAGGRPRVLPRDGATPAAVLLLIYPRDGRECILLTERSAAVEHHKGQISFPGGGVDEGDGSAEETALRETFEEVGVPPEGIEILGRLDDYRTGTNFLVTPVVGVLNEAPHGFTPSPVEVAEVQEVPIEHLLDPENFIEEHRERDGVEFVAPAYDFEGRRIWGVTAQILTHLLDLLRDG
jgi:8-oxo-dGTP pyrophosphatase MutT (NUDIX family)